MIDRFVLGFVLILLVIGGIDYAAFDSAGFIFIARKLADLIEYLAFWR